MKARIPCILRRPCILGRREWYTVVENCPVRYYLDFWQVTEFLAEIFPVPSQRTSWKHVKRKEKKIPGSSSETSFCECSLKTLCRISPWHQWWRHADFDTSKYLMFQCQLYALLRCQVHADVATGRGANCVLSSLCWCPYLGLSFLFHILFIIGPVCKDWTYNLIKITPFFGFSCQTVEHSTSKKSR